MMQLPKIFIGSSQKAIETAKEFQSQLSSYADCSIWDNGDIFELGTGTLESLVNKIEQFDFAIIIFSADDKTESNEMIKNSPRDNLLIECGLFISKIGRERTFITFDISSNLKIPSDLAGITFAEFNLSKHSFENAISIAANKIRKTINNLGKIEKNQATRFKEIRSQVKNNGIKIGFSGAQSVGKTSTCMDLEKEFDKIGISCMKHSGVARQLKMRGLTSDKQTDQNDYAVYISSHINNIYNNLHSTIQLFDRTLVDVFSFAQANDNLHPYWEQMLSDLIRITLKDFDYYFFIPIQDFVTLEDDGVRGIDPIYRKLINDNIELTLKTHYPQYFRLSGDQPERTKNAFAIINDHIKKLQK